jgi:hypothetical protein
MSEDYDDFDWKADRDAIVQGEVPKLAVYRNIDGDVVLRAKAAWNEDEDPVVVVAQGNVMKVCRAMLDAADIQVWELDEWAGNQDRAQKNRSETVSEAQKNRARQGRGEEAQAEEEGTDTQVPQAHQACDRGGAKGARCRGRPRLHLRRGAVQGDGWLSRTNNRVLV